MMKKARVPQGMKGLLIAAFALLVLAGTGKTAFADATGTVVPASANIRQSADSASAVVGATTQGTTLTILGQTSDPSGTVWYEVYVDANTTGFIRADLVNLTSDDTIPQSTGTSTSTDADDAAEDADGEVGMDAQYATISVEKAKVRSGPSTDNSVVDTLDQGTEVIVSGQDDDSTGKTWYFVTFTGTEGSELTGYIRYDLLTLGDLVPVEDAAEETEEEISDEDAAVTAPVEETPDYELLYATNEDGEYAWYIYDNVEGTRQKLEDVLTAAHAQNTNQANEKKTISRQRIVLVILAALLVLAIAAIVILILKYRDLYYETYEVEELPPTRRPSGSSGSRSASSGSSRSSGSSANRSASGSANRSSSSGSANRSSSGNSANRSSSSGNSANRSSSAGNANRGSNAGSSASGSASRSSSGSTSGTSSAKSSFNDEDFMPKKEVTYEEDTRQAQSAEQKRKPKNFLMEDEDFEFEFLNMKDDKK